MPRPRPAQGRARACYCATPSVQNTQGQYNIQRLIIKGGGFRAEMRTWRMVQRPLARSGFLTKGCAPPPPSITPTTTASGDWDQKRHDLKNTALAMVKAECGFGNGLEA